MKTKLLTGLVMAAAAVTGTIANASSASAFTWNSSWTAPTISSKTQAGFNDVPYQQYVQQERVELPNSGQFSIDPSKLFLKYDHDVTVSFINEGAGYRNQLAYQSTGATQGSGLLFDDVSCMGLGCVGDWGTTNAPLKLGDTVSLGKVQGESRLDFFLKADGANGGQNVYGSQVASNPDGLQHVVAYAVNKRYLLLGFEDLFGEKGGIGNSDRDFNDTVFVVDIGEKNFKSLTGQTVPEPSVTLSLLGLGAAGMMLRRGRQAKVSK